MVVDIRNESNEIISDYEAREIVAVSRAGNSIMLSGTAVDPSDVMEGCYLTVHGSYEKEITGLGAIFDMDREELYGVDRTKNGWMMPYIRTGVGTLKESYIQLAIDVVEEESGETPDMIITSWGVRRALLNILSSSKRLVDTVELKGGFKSITYNGIPVVVDKFCPRNTMYLLNTKDFALHQLCDWQWLTGDDGKILHQIPGKPVYTATLVKYAELMCARPYAQAVLFNVTEA